jgi:hypothetical protein
MLQLISICINIFESATKIHEKGKNLFTNMCRVPTEKNLLGNSNFLDSNLEIHYARAGTRGRKPPTVQREGGGRSQGALLILNSIDAHKHEVLSQIFQNIQKRYPKFSPSKRRTIRP